MTSSRPVTLHEQLAIEGQHEAQASKVRTELVSTFNSKRHLFEEKHVVFTPLVEGQPQEKTVQSTLQSTITQELEWIAPYLSKALDSSLQVAEANTQARADIILEDSGKVIATGVPATALLELSKRIAEIKILVEAIPTLDPAKGFVADPAHALARFGVFLARAVRKPRTAKVKEVLKLAPATEKHPEQVQVIDVDKLVGHTDDMEWSGLISPAVKADLIHRVEVMARAVKAARARANDVTVDRSRKYGDAILGFIFKG